MVCRPSTRGVNGLARNDRFRMRQRPYPSSKDQGVSLTADLHALRVCCADAFRLTEFDLYDLALAPTQQRLIGRRGEGRCAAYTEAQDQSPASINPALVLQ